jgi:hypothetical protein
MEGTAETGYDGHLFRKKASGLFRKNDLILILVIFGSIGIFLLNTEESGIIPAMTIVQ